MGWDYTHATHYTRTGAIDRKTEIDELYTWQNDTRKALDHVKIIARLLFSLFSPLLIQNMPITGARDAERTLKQRKIRTH